MGVMAGTLVTIIALVYIFIQPIKSECCKMKMAGGKTYKFEKMGDTSDFDCMDKCIYSESGSSGIDYCFKEGGDTMVQCMDMDNQGNTDKPQEEEEGPTPTSPTKPPGSETKPAPKPPGSDPPSTSAPTTGRTCPKMFLMHKCKVNCGNGEVSPESGRKCPFQDGDLDYSGRSIINGVTTDASSSLLMREGSKDDACKLKCADENNLEVTTRCDLIEGKMQWTVPETLKQKCGSPPKEICDVSKIVEKCNINCLSVSAGPFGPTITSERFSSDFEITITLPIGVEGDELDIRNFCLFEEALQPEAKATCTRTGGKLEWSIPKNLKDKCNV